MLDLDCRLRSGPLHVGSVWTPDWTERVAWRALRRKRALALSSVAVAATACAVALFAWPQVRPASRAPAPAARAVRFTDGSIGAPRGPNAELQVEEQSAHRVRVRLRGGARFEIAKNAARRFEVRAGEVLVRVLGTVFTVDEESSRARVEVERGRVQVIWRGGEALLVAGEVGTFPPIEEAWLPDVERAEAAPATAIEPATATAPRRARPAARAEDEAADLMLAADVARLSADPAAAVAPLRRLIARYPRDKRAPVAAFTLGRVLLDDLGRASEAAAAFERARQLWPEGPLAGDALARAVEAHRRAARPERARPLAGEYLRRFPEGRHAPAMRKALAP